MSLSILIIWVLFIGAVLFLVIMVGNKFRSLKAVQKQNQKLYEEKKARYQVLSDDMFDDIPEVELTHAVIFQIMAKEDAFYDQEELEGQFIDTLSPSEQLIYTIYQVENSMQGGKGSIHSFFINQPYCQCRPFYKDAYEAIQCHEITKVLSAAEHLAILIETDQEDEIDEDSDYATYNFSDFTNELISLIRAGGVMDKCNAFIKEHRQDFISETK